MESDDIKTKVKLGIFVAVGVVIFLLAVFLLGRGGSLFNKTFSVSAVFTNVEGLKVGDNIWLSGVKVGTVKHVEIVSEGRVIVRLNLNEAQNEFIKKDATASVGSDGLVGNKIVIIKTGSAKETIQAGDTINSFTPTGTQQLFDLANEVGIATRGITDDLKAITGQLKNGEGVLGDLLNDGPISEEIRVTLASLKKSAEQTERLINQANTMMGEVKTGDGLVTKLLTDTAYANTFESTLNNIDTTSVNTKKMTEDLRSIIDQMNNNDNAIGLMLSDSAAAIKLESTLDNLNSSSYKLDENMEALQHNFLFRGYFKKQAKKEEKLKKAEGN